MLYQPPGDSQVSSSTRSAITLAMKAHESEPNGQRIQADSLPQCSWHDKRNGHGGAWWRFVQFFNAAGCDMKEMTCAHHDSLASRTQFVTHTIGRVLGAMDLEVSELLGSNHIRNPRPSPTSTILRCQIQAEHV